MKRIGLIAAFGLLLTLLLTVVKYANPKTSESLAANEERPYMSTYMAKISKWINEHKYHKQGELAKTLNLPKEVKLERSKAKEPAEIQFEFYSVLPSMKMSVSLEHENKPIITARNQRQFIKADDIEKEIASHIKQKQNHKRVIE